MKSRDFVVDEVYSKFKHHVAEALVWTPVQFEIEIPYLDGAMQVPSR